MDFTADSITDFTAIFIMDFTANFTLNSPDFIINFMTNSMTSNRISPKSNTILLKATGLHEIQRFQKTS